MGTNRIIQEHEIPEKTIRSINFKSRKFLSKEIGRSPDL
ncbi:hypothetical protein M2254_002909 [Chryseobacterium sp. BIGb0186]|nr:hypothetical protein [Chryseobacterium sp. JUb44]MDH6211325.1 hypothetical protein [Chryseobacterium sp. BIGb0186]